MKKIPVGPTKFALVDDQDYAELSAFKWHFNKSGRGYAGRMFRKDGKRHEVLMHRQILGLGPQEHTDHINGNGLDNRRKNLRPCNRSQNMCNRRCHKNNKCGIKGVRAYKGRWEARIQVRNKPIHLGYYTSSQHAMIAYDAAARAIHGAFARPNKP